MKQDLAIKIFECLSSAVRLDIYRLLMKKGLDGLVAGEIVGALALPPTNVSFHLKVLTQASLISVEQEGRYQRYRANMPLMIELISYLTEECCSGDMEQCMDFRSVCGVKGEVVSSVSSSTKSSKR